MITSYTLYIYSQISNKRLIHLLIFNICRWIAKNYSDIILNTNMQSNSLHKTNFGKIFFRIMLHEIERRWSCQPRKKNTQRNMSRTDNYSCPHIFFGGRGVSDGKYRNCSVPPQSPPSRCV